MQSHYIVYYNKKKKGFSQFTCEWRMSKHVKISVLKHVFRRLH